MTPEPSAIQGRLREGAVASEVPVRIDLDGDMLLVTVNDSVRRVPHTAIRVDAPLPGVACILTLPDGSQIETDDREALAALLGTGSRIETVAFWLESRWTAALASIPLIAGLAWLVFGALLPRAAEPVARMVSPKVERAMGRQALATLDRIALQGSKLDIDTQLRVESDFRSLVAGESGEESYALEFRSGIGANAFALPGGIIVVTDEMVKLAANDAELVAVLAHEIGHIRGRHAVRLILQDSGVIVLVTALAGDAASMTFLAATLPTVLLQSHYSREFEIEADDYAFAQLKRHGYSPQAFADMMRRLQQSYRGTSPKSALRYFSTHPLTEERIERAERAAAST